MTDSLENNQDIIFMKVALVQAGKALKKEEVPVGAVVVDSMGNIIGKSYNYTEHLASQTGHAEVRAIIKATQKRGDWRLDDCKIYITLEPCLMCFGLIRLSRIKEIIYCVKSPLFGVGLDNETSFTVYKNGLKIRQGVMEDESVSLLKMFFKQRRMKKEKV